MNEGEQGKTSTKSNAHVILCNTVEKIICLVTEKLDYLLSLKVWFRDTSVMCAFPVRVTIFCHCTHKLF